MFLAHTTSTQAPEVAAAVVGACRLGDAWDSDFQPHFLELIFHELLGVDLDFKAIDGINVQQAAQSFPEPLQRLELIELMVLVEIMLNPVPSMLEASVEQWAKELEVHDRSLVLARDVAAQARLQAQSDFYRLFWMGEEDRRQKDFDQLLKAHGPQTWTFTMEPDPELAAQWRS